MKLTFSKAEEKHKSLLLMEDYDERFYQEKSVLLTIVVSFFAVQSVYAVETDTVTGTIDTISTKPNKIVVDGIEVSGISFNRKIERSS